MARHNISRNPNSPRKQIGKVYISGIRRSNSNSNTVLFQQAICGLPIAVSNTSDAAPCIVLGITYLHSQQISRDDPCDFCLCLDGEVFCWWQQQCVNNTQQTHSSEANTTASTESDEWFDGDNSLNSTEVSTTTEDTCRVMVDMFAP
ncbi:uncharacterized protein [Halyomorpha halys]|uniref:uncharacterized protein n=1 Tax=Halyomorpha halys TaxID=286706 RepID=UPI0034D23D01